MLDKSKRFIARNPFLIVFLRLVDRILRLFPKPPTVPIVPENVKRVLLSNIAHHGDVIIATSAINVIKKAYPNAKIGFLTSKSCRKIVRHHPDVTFTHVFDHFKVDRHSGYLIAKLWNHFWTSRRALKKVRALKYDLAIDLYFYFPNSVYFFYRAKIPTRVGFTSGGFGRLLTHSVPFIPKNQHIMDYYKELFALLYINPTFYEKMRLNLPRYEIDIRKKFNLDRYALFHPGSGARHKEWDVDKWRKLYKSTEGIQVVFTGVSEYERNMVKEISPSAYNLCHELEWKDLTELVCHAEYVVCVDTAIQHVAAAFNVPCVVLSTGINPPKLFAHEMKRVQSLYVKTLCFNCNRKRGCTSMACIRSISVERVQEKLKELCKS